VREKPTYTGVMAKMARRIMRSMQLAEFHDERLAALERRIAKLDGGAGPEAAAQSALADLSARKIESGKRAPEFRLVGDTIQWNARLRDSRSR
jgi:hypothetical protein